MSDFHVVLQPSGLEFSVAAGQSVLAGAEAAGITLPSSCRNGTCRTCLCTLVAGNIRYLVEWPGLSADEKREGAMLPCVAVPESNLRLAVLARRAQDEA